MYNGYFNHKKRGICSIDHYAEGLRVFHFDTSQIQIYPHKDRGDFEPISVRQALDSHLNETEKYINQIRYNQLISKIEKEPDLPLIALDASKFKKRTKLAMQYSGSGGTIGSTLRLRGIWDNIESYKKEHKDTIILCFDAEFSDPSDDYDDGETIKETFIRISVNANLFENFDEKKYKKWWANLVADRKKCVIDYWKLKVEEASNRLKSFE